MIKELQRINRILYFVLVIIISFSFFFVEKNDRIYNCLAISVKNESMSFYIVQIDKNDIFKINEYTVNGNDYSNALSKALDEGYEIDLTVLKSIFISKDLSENNLKRFYSYAKNVFDLTSCVYLCDCDILSKEDIMGNEGTLIIPSLYGRDNGGVLFGNVFNDRFVPPEIIYDGEKFILIKYD